MKPFTKLSGWAAPLFLDNIDTDMIIPKQFLKTIKRSGLGPHAFSEMRYNADGSPNPAFVLNQEPFTQAQVLLTGDNFGCGSSREHAPWALSDFGIRCIIAESFADIFFSNAAKNGMLLISLPKSTIQAIYDRAQNDTPLQIDLQEQRILVGNESWHFDIDAARKNRLLHGLDDIGTTIQHTDAIESFEESRKKETPWLL